MIFLSQFLPIIYYFLLGCKLFFGHSLTMYCLIKRKTRPQERERHRRAEKERDRECGKEAEKGKENCATQLYKLRNCCCCTAAVAPSKCPAATRQNQQGHAARVVGSTRPPHRCSPSPPPPASLPVQLIIQVKIFISCDPYKISQVVVTVSVSVSSPLPCFVPCLALLFHSVRQLLTLPQMTAPKMAGCPFRLVGMGQVREASSTHHRHRRRRLVCCGKFMVANCFAPDRGKQGAGQKRLARGG